VSPPDVTEETFERDVVERSHEQPVVVDFWAEWCGPCHALAPVLEQAVAERNGDVELVKVDVDANPELSRRFGVHGIPAVKAFRNGQVVREFVGAQPPRVVSNFLDDLTAPTEADRLIAELRERGTRPELVEAIDRGDHEAAFELLLAELEDGGDREEVRRLMVALFEQLGPEHPLTVRYRRRLATALY
jgi:putative thioredoxin